MLNPSNIDIGEALVACIGVKKIFLGRFNKILQSDMDKVTELPVKIERMAKKLVAGTLSAREETNPEKYSEILDKLSNDSLAIESITEVLNKLPQHLEAVDSALDVIKKSYDLLHGVMPASVYQNMVSTVNLAVSDPQWWAFQESFELLNNPLLVFNEIASGEMLQSQATAVREIFPTISQAIDDAIFGACTDKLSVVKSWELPYDVEYGYSTWKLMPLDIAPYQQSYSMANARRQIAPSPSSAASNPMAAGSQSAAERAALQPVTGK